MAQKQQEFVVSHEQKRTKHEILQNYIGQLLRFTISIGLIGAAIYAV